MASGEGGGFGEMGEGSLLGAPKNCSPAGVAPLDPHYLTVCMVCFTKQCLMWFIFNCLLKITSMIL